MEYKSVQISTDGGKEFKEVVCASGSISAKTCKFIGKNEKGEAVFTLWDGSQVTTEYQDWLKEGEVYEYRFNA